MSTATAAATTASTTTTTTTSNIETPLSDEWLSNLDYGELYLLSKKITTRIELDTDLSVLESECSSDMTTVLSSLIQIYNNLINLFNSKHNMVKNIVSESFAFFIELRQLYELIYTEIFILPESNTDLSQKKSCNNNHNNINIDGDNKDFFQPKQKTPRTKAVTVPVNPSSPINLINSCPNFVMKISNSNDTLLKYPISKTIKTGNCNNDKINMLQEKVSHSKNKIKLYLEKSGEFEKLNRSIKEGLHNFSMSIKYISSLLCSFPEKTQRLDTLNYKNLDKVCQYLVNVLQLEEGNILQYQLNVVVKRNEVIQLFNEIQVPTRLIATRNERKFVSPIF